MSNPDPFDSDSEASFFDEEGAYDDALAMLTEMERRGALEEDSRIAAHITLDLQDKGPLYLYVKERRDKAISDLRVLVETPPDSPQNIARLIAAQASFAEFRKVTRFIHGGLQNGERAAEIIKEEYGYEPGEDGDLLQTIEPGAEPDWRRRRR